MILGVDVSEYQGPMDWLKCKSAGAEFVYFRVGNGPDSIDDMFTCNRDTAPEIFPTGGYWAFHPAWPAAGQADLFCDLLSTWKWQLPPWIDVELLGGITCTERTKRLEEFVYRVIQRTKILPVIYTRAEWFNTNILRRQLWPCCGLAIARYAYLTGPWSDGKCKPKDWNEFLFWQFSADGNHLGDRYGAQSDSIDLTWYTGVLSGVTSTVSTCRAEWLRWLPAASADIVGATWNNVQLERIGDQEDWVKVAGWIPKASLK